jgi:hypothetical protein
VHSREKGRHRGEMEIKRWSDERVGKAEEHLCRRLSRHCPVKEGEGAMKLETKRTRGRFLVGMLLGSALGVSSVAMALEVGQQAPDFTLPSTEGKELSLSQFRGKQPVLIEFYGGDFFPV